jgi:hypothetical protein
MDKHLQPNRINDNTIQNARLSKLFISDYLLKEWAMMINCYGRELSEGKTPAVITQFIAMDIVVYS